MAHTMLMLVLLLLLPAAALSSPPPPPSPLAPRRCVEAEGGGVWSYLYCHQDAVWQFPTASSSPPHHGARDVDSSGGTSGSGRPDPRKHILLGVFQHANNSSSATAQTNSSPTATSSRAPAAPQYTFKYVGGRMCEVAPHVQRSVEAHARCCRSGPGVTVTEAHTCRYTVHICAPELCPSGLTHRSAVDFTSEEKADMLHRIKTMFYHGYDNYMMHAFPSDELRPLSCTGVNSELTAGKMLTLIDSLDTLVILGNRTEFFRAVKLVASHERDVFEVDVTCNVFESTIRILGGLLSAHLLAVDPLLDFRPPGYDGALLRMARGLANKLLPAFNTSTTLPYGTVNLMRGVPYMETTEACTAAAGSLSLEFGILSTLTGDDQYGDAARSSLRTLYSLRSSQDLLGRHVDVQSGKWTETLSGVGSNVDSTFEYFLKQYILFGDDESYEWFVDLYAGALEHLRIRDGGGRFYQDRDMYSGNVVRRVASALQAFWPGLQVLMGDLQAASKTLNAFMAVHEAATFVPEDFDLTSWSPMQGGTHAAYLLRPELAESVYYMFRATRNTSWLLASRDIFNNIENHCRVPCGYASVLNVKSMALMDSMPSYFLSELVKYLHLTFDENHFLNVDNFVFSTEAHPFRVTKRTQQASFMRKNRKPPHSALARSHTKARNPNYAQYEDVPSLKHGQGVWGECYALLPNETLAVVEPYYLTIPEPFRPWFRPFSPAPDAPAGAPLPQQHEQQEGGGTVTHGQLPGLGTFRAEAVEDAFVVTREETKEMMSISDLNRLTITIQDSLGRVVFLGRDSLVGSRCEVHVALADMCLAWAWPGPVLDSEPLVPWRRTFPCAPGDGMGQEPWATWTESEWLPLFEDPPPLQQESESDTLPSQGCGLGGGHLYPGQGLAKFVRRGECTFEQKSKLAYAQQARLLLVSLVNSEDGLFLMTGATTSGVQQATVPSFLIPREAGMALHAMRSRPVRVQVNRVVEPRCVFVSQNEFLVRLFPKWEVSVRMSPDGRHFLSVRLPTALVGGALG